MTLARVVRGVARRLAIVPLKVVDAATRAEAIELLSDQAIAIVDAGVARLKFYAPSRLLRARAAGVLSKEPDTIAWLDGLAADAVLWDIGANVGAFALYVAATRRCRVLAFEPSAANFFALTRNVELNGLAERVTAYCLAVAPATQLGLLNLDSSAIGAAMSQFGKAGEASRYATGGRTPIVHGATGVTLDDLIAHFNAPPPTHIKMDVDGLELPILLGGSTLLARPELREVMVELSLTHQAERDRAVQWLRDRGFQLQSQGEPQGEGTEQAANHLFVRR